MSLNGEFFKQEQVLHYIMSQIVGKFGAQVLKSDAVL